jgi:two-component system chemotaxis response regulator CheB
MPYEAVVIGVSAGGFQALRAIVPALRAGFPAPVLIVQHISPNADDFLARMLDEMSYIGVKEVEEKERAMPGWAYIAPPNYHLLVEMDKTLSLSTESRVNFSRPAIDVLFESASDAWGAKLIGVVLTGANDDGSRGLKLIKSRGGLTIVQDPTEAEVPSMPRAAIELADPDHILRLKDIAGFLNRVV